MENKEVKVKREKLRPCMTCPLCHKLLRDATSIIECLHTFCRRCIRRKLLNEEMNCCPVCNTSLGCVPLEKLRADHNLQDLRSKLFPKRRAMIEAPPVVVLPAKRKERSLSSLVVTTPKVYTHVGKTGGRSKHGARKASKASASSIDKHLENSTSQEMSTTDTPDVKQNSFACEVSEAAADLWKPLTFLAEAANKSKSTEAAKSDDLKGACRKTETKTKYKEVKVKNENFFRQSAPSEGHKPTKDSLDSREITIPLSSTSLDSRKHPIWFSLVASDEVREDLLPLPQISASFLRIKDGSIPVSFIEKYLKKKLDLSNEAEVEIRCMGQTISPSLTLDQLVELWLRTAATPLPVPATVGESAKDFLMVLTYGRRHSHSTTA